MIHVEGLDDSDCADGGEAGVGAEGEARAAAAALCSLIRIASA